MRSARIVSVAWASSDGMRKRRQNAGAESTHLRVAERRCAGERRSVVRQSHSAIANVPTMHSVYVNADQPGASHVQIATGQTGHHPVVISQRRHADPSSQPVNRSLCASTHWSPPCGDGRRWR